MFLTRLAVKYPSLTAIALLLIIVWGLGYFNVMSKREDPELVIRACQVVTFFPGALPEDIEQYVTKPIEDVAAEISEVSEIDSYSRYNISIVVVMLDQGIREGEVDQIWDELRAKIDNMRGELPAGAYDPVVDTEFFDVSSHIIAVSGENYSQRELAAFAERIKNQLTPLSNAGRVTVVGERPEVIYLEYDQARMARYGVNFEQLLATVQGTNVLLPGGEMDINGQMYSIDSSGGFASLEDIRSLPVYGTPGARQVRLEDLGTVRYGYEEPPEYLPRINGKPCALVVLVLKTGKNVLKLGRQVEDKLAQIRQSLPADVEITIAHNQPEHVRKKTNIFLGNLYSGIGLVIVVVFLFMGLRPSVPVGLAIPVVIVASFAVMSVVGTTLQQMSIAGLIIALGMLVDNAIVVTDNVSRHLDAGMERKRAAVQATQELAMPMLTSSLTTVCAFLPIVMLPGETGEFVGDISIVVSIAILASFVIALTITPTICSLVLVKTKGRKVFQPLDPLMKLLERNYPPMLHWTQRNGLLTGIIILALFVGSLGLFPLLGIQFFPSAERNQFAIDIFLPHGSSVYETLDATKQVEQILDGHRKWTDSSGKTHQGVTSYLAHVGQGSPQYYYNRISENPNSRYAEILVNTQDERETDLLVPRIRHNAHEQVAGARVEVKTLEQGPPVGAPIQIKLRGENIGELKSLGEQVKGILAGLDNVIDIEDSFGNDSPQLLLALDETQLRSIGLTKQDVNKLTSLYFSGFTVTEYRAPSRTIPIKLRAYPGLRSSASDIESMYLYNAYTGTPVPLSSIGSVETQMVTSNIVRSNRVRELTVSAYLSGGRLASSAIKEAKPELQQLDLPPGYELVISGEAEESSEAFGNLGTSALIALLLIVLILVSQFKSIRIGLVVFLAIPLALIGAVLGLFITGWPFGFTAGLGVLSLAGIVINNSIVLMDFIMEELKKGRSLDEAISEAGQARLRPIILTTSTTIGGLLPLGLFGGSMWAPMAFGIIGGLIASTFLTLIVVPLLFKHIAGKRALQLTQDGENNEAATQPS